MPSPTRIQGPDDPANPTGLSNMTVDTQGRVSTKNRPGPYAPVRKTGDYTTTQTAVALWTPATGKKFVLTDIVVSTATAGGITLLDSATIIREYKFIANGGAVENMRTEEPSGAVGNVLKVTTSGNLDCFIVVKGWEE